MRRHKSLIPLSQDHHHGLMLAQLLKKDAPIYKGLPSDLNGKASHAINAWLVELKPHFENEENVLFPFIYGKDKEVDKLIDEILSEHTELEKLFNSIDELQPNAELLNTIGVLLQKHIRKEERELFEKIQSNIDLKILEQLNDRITTVIPKKGGTC